METPICDFCGTTRHNHNLIYSNVKNTLHDLVECQCCRLRFYSPRTAWADYLSRGYGVSEGSRKEAEFMFNHANFTRTCDKQGQVAILRNYYSGVFINTLLEMRPNLASVYEVGGSVGWFSHLLKEKKPSVQVDGCDVNSFAVAIANKEFGHNYTAGSFLDAPVISGKLYDCIVALDYIEHTFTPFQDLQKMASICAPGGVLLLKTFLEELDVNREMEAPIGHSHHFFGPVLRRMLEVSGFEIVSWKEEVIMVNVICEKM
jgi:SAM-dependent methyltransferase